MATVRKIPDDLWEELQSIIPSRPDRSKGGRPPADVRLLFDGMFYILRTGAAWREMPDKYGPWSTVYDRFREWRDAKVFEQLWAKCLHYYEQKYGIIWEWQSSDGTYVRSPMGGKRERPQSDRPRQARNERSYPR